MTTPIQPSKPVQPSGSVPAQTAAPAPAPAQKTAPPPKRYTHVKRPRVGKNVAGCVLYALIAVLVVLCLILFFVAKTGAFTIPLFSSFYKGTQPTRLVTAGVWEPDAFIEHVSLNISDAVRRGDAPPYSVDITEEELTAAVRGGLADVIRADQVYADRPQIVVTPEYLEASGVFTTDMLTLDLLIRFVPRVEEGELKFDIDKAYIGDIPVAPDMAMALESYLFKRGLGSWSVNVGSSELVGVELGDGSLELLLSAP